MHIGIIGTGLIGTSLARSLVKTKTGTVHLYDRSAATLAKARSLAVADHYHDTPGALAQNCTVIFLCVPVCAIGDTIAALAPNMIPGTIISDVGSVKAQVMQDAAPHVPRHSVFIPGHPVAGSEKAGPEHGHADLFQNRAWVLTPQPGTDAQALDTITTIIRSTGAHALHMSAEAHDKVFAYTSHMPHVLAFCALKALTEVSERAGIDALPFAGASFEGLTRTGRADGVMWRDILCMNADEILASLTVYQRELAQLSALIEARDEDGIKAYIEAAGAVPHPTPEREAKQA